MSWNSGLQLRVIGGSERDRVIPLLSKEIILGRAAGPRSKPKDGHVHFTDPTVSRAHASMLWDHRKKVYVLTHLSRTNSTRVNGEIVMQAPVKVGSTIQMGHILLSMEKISKRAEEPAAEPEAEAAEAGLWEIELTPVMAASDAPSPDVDLELLRELEPAYYEGAIPDVSGYEPDIAAPAPPPPQEPTRPSSLPPGLPPIPKVQPPLPPPPVRRKVPLYAPGDFPPPSAEARPDAPVARPTGWRAVVVDGPDRGTSIPIGGEEMLLGRTMGLADPRFGHALLIGDSTLPYEQATLQWLPEEATFRIQSHPGGLPMRIVRLSGQEIEVDPGDSMLVFLGDKLSVGKTILEFEMMKRRG